jgi:hypothetical protein
LYLRIIVTAFALITEGFICLVDFLELCFRFCVAGVLVRMAFLGELAKRAFDRSRFGCFINAENLIEVLHITPEY